MQHGAKQPLEGCLQKKAEIQAHLSQLKQLKKHENATLSCLNSDSNFPKMVPVDFKKFQSV